MIEASEDYCTCDEWMVEVEDTTEEVMKESLVWRSLLLVDRDGWYAKVIKRPTLGRALRVNSTSLPRNK